MDYTIYSAFQLEFCLLEKKYEDLNSYKIHIIFFISSFNLTLFCINCFTRDFSKNVPKPRNLDAFAQIDVCLKNELY